MIFDVIVLGGGALGCLTALKLQKRGLKCALVDVSSLMSGASLNNAGGIYLQTQHQAGNVSHEQRTLIQDLIPLLQHTREAWLEINHYLGEAVYQQTGGVIVASDSEQVAALQKKVDFETTWGIPTRLLSPKEIQNQFSDAEIPVKAACYHEQEGFAETRRFTNLLYLQLQASQVAIFENAFDPKTTKLSKKASGFELKTNKATLVAPQIVGCLGAFSSWLTDSLQLQLTIQQLPIQMMISPPLPKCISSFVRYVGARLSVKQIADGRVLVGGGWPAIADPSNPSGAKICPLNIQKNWELATQFFPILKKYEPEQTRCGVAAWTDDGIPLLGELTENVFVACGGNGFSLTPLYASILEKLVLQDSLPFSIQAFSPRRFLDQQENFAVSLPPD